jgi:flagellar assembly factor FliW
VKAVSDRYLRGQILGFEECEQYTMQAAFGEISPFRLLVCDDAPLSFIAVDPYYILDDYSFEIEDHVLENLFADGNRTDDMAILCLVRQDEEHLYVNLRSPLIVNTKRDIFVQIILQSDSYGVSVPFEIKKTGSEA